MRNERGLVSGLGCRKRWDVFLPKARELGRAGLREDLNPWEATSSGWGGWGLGLWGRQANSLGLCLNAATVLVHEAGQALFLESSIQCQMGETVVPTSGGWCGH